MKKFSFPLQRVLDLRRQQAELERAKLQPFVVRLQKLEAAREYLRNQAHAASASVRSAHSVTGGDLAALGRYERYTDGRIRLLDQHELELRKHIEAQQMVVREADRKVKLLENLRDQRLIEWTAQRDKELEEVASDSYLAKLLSERRLLSDVDAPAGPLLLEEPGD